MKTSHENCPVCDGSGVIDSGGIDPSGAWIPVPCPGLSPEPETVNCRQCEGTGVDTAHGSRADWWQCAGCQGSGRVIPTPPAAS